MADQATTGTEPIEGLQMGMARLGWLVCAGIGLSGCARPTMPTTMNSTNSASINYVRNNFDTRASVIEGQYYGYAQPGIPNLIREIQACYGRATRSTNVLDIRDCLVVDYTAFNEIQDEARDSHQPAPAFFDDEKIRARLAHYGPLAQFDSVPQMITYLKNTHELIHGLLVRDDEARRYLYQHLPRQPRTLQ